MRKVVTFEDVMDESGHCKSPGYSGRAIDSEFIFAFSRKVFRIKHKSSRRSSYDVFITKLLANSSYSIIDLFCFCKNFKEASVFDQEHYLQIMTTSFMIRKSIKMMRIRTSTRNFGNKGFYLNCEADMTKPMDFIVDKFG